VGCSSRARGDNYVPRASAIMRSGPSNRGGQLSIPEIVRAGSRLVVLTWLLGACGAAPQLYDSVWQYAPWLSSDVRTVSWSGDGKYLAAGFINPEVHIWKMPSGEEVGNLSDFGGGIAQVAWSPRTAQLAVISNQPQNGLRIWDPLTGQAVTTLAGATYPYMPAWSPNGTTLAVAEQSGVQLYDTAQWKLTRTLPYTEETPALAWSPDGHMLAVSRDEKIGVGYIDLWDMASAQQVQTISWSDWAGNLSWSPDGHFLAAPGAGQAVQIWDLTNRQITVTLQHDDRVRDMEWAPNGQRLATVTADKIWFWKPTTGALLKTIPYSHNATAGRWSPDSAYFAVAGLLGNVTVYKTK
jgi:WD40 repeat protein